MIKKCFECGQELKFWKSYHHPTLGDKSFVCSKCFDIIAESMEKYRNFILSEMKPEELESNVNISDIKSIFFKWFNNLKNMH
jgi:hypothetical protein